MAHAVLRSLSDREGASARIGSVRLGGRVMLAPLAGVTDLPFRLLAREFGAALTTTEMVSAEGIVRGCRRTLEYARFDARERPVAVQLYGGDPIRMAEAARIVVDAVAPDIVDLNFGCPVRKIVAKGAGSACLRDPGRLAAIVAATTEAVTVPVTVKIRSGWDRPIAPSLVRGLEEAGAAAVTIHGRTREQGYAGAADWGVVRDAVREARTVKIIGNGDVASSAIARDRFEHSGCDFIMIGRGAVGRPWIFRQILHELATEEALPDPPSSERVRVCIRHYELALAYKERDRAVWEMRPHVVRYLRDLPCDDGIGETVLRDAEPERVLGGLRRLADRLADQGT